MEWKFLAERNIDLWRYALQQFSTSITYTGIFYKAGYKNYIVDTKLRDIEGNEKTPDIVSWGDSKWVIMELTLGNDSEKKNKQLEDYSNIDPVYLKQQGGNTRDSPDVMLGVFEFIDDVNYCQILFGSKINHMHLELLKDPLLKKLIKEESKNQSPRPPSTRFSLVPESQGIEVRNGVAPIIIEFLASSDDEITLETILESALDVLYSKTSPESKKRLRENVKSELHVLITKSGMNKYITYGKRTKQNITYCKTETGKDISTPASYKAINNILNVWKDKKSNATQTEILDYPT